MEWIQSSTKEKLEGKKMNKVYVNYDSEGKISGFYPDDLDYKVFPTPYIVVDPIQYAEIKKNPGNYRIKNKELVNILDTAEFMQNNFDNKLANTEASIITLAESLRKNAILELDGHRFNVAWRDFYEKLLGIDSNMLHIKMYENDTTKVTFVEFMHKDAQKFLKKAIKLIDEFTSKTLIEMQQKHIEELNGLKESKDIMALDELSNNLYGSYCTDSDQGSCY